MNKKIIAVFCVVVLMVAVFSACGKKYETANIGGRDLPIVTDENGELVTDSEGMYAVYVTDENGEKVTAEDGSPNINFTPNTGNSPVIYNNKVTVTLDESLAKFTVNVIDGWTVGESNGRLYKDGTDMNCNIEISKASVVTEEDSFKSYMDSNKVTNETVIAKINSGEYKANNYGKAEMKAEKGSFLGNEAEILRFTIYGTDGTTIVHYAESLYFVGEDGVIYLINYLCTNGAGYDTSFNFYDWANNNIKMNYPVKAKS